ncbi:hypothetical protein EYC84_010850 [Monilinia fructicola]|uniref:Uncharacterized protein n=1 Tax=Monilinia fructicola TaxID=38448 RepID=A0A5M9J975_MONFR|nr:hypothetical protein EYC84_010850 [Monilinia fructicola]
MSEERETKPFKFVTAGMQFLPWRYLRSGARISLHAANFSWLTSLCAQVPGSRDGMISVTTEHSQLGWIKDVCSRCVSYRVIMQIDERHFGLIRCASVYGGGC